MNIIQFLRQWDHLPLSKEKNVPTLISNGELKRMAEQRGIWVNGGPIGPQEELPEEITSLIMWPKSIKNRTTWI